MEERIFKAYDIRGLFEKEIDLDDIEDIFFSILDVFKPTTISIAHDARKENIMIYEKVKSLCEKINNIQVFFLGRVPTTIFYIYNKLKNIDIGIILTASHNPKGYIGIKIVKKGESISPGDLKKIKEIAFEYKKKKKFEIKDTKNKSIREISLDEILEVYFEYLVNSIPLKYKRISGDPPKIIFDVASGSFSSPFIEGFLLRLKELVNIEYDLINHVDDKGEFKSHPPDTSNINNYRDLIERCKANRSWGIGFDGDGDRILVVDPRGIVYPSEYIAYLISKYYEFKNILIEVSVSKYVSDLMEKEGMNIKMIRTGHIFMEENMKSCGMEIGVERSGHFYFKTRKYGYVEDAILIMVLFLFVISDTAEREKIMENSVRDLNYFYDVKKIDFEGGFLAIKNTIRDRFRECNIIEIDGIRVECDKHGFWFLIRKSNTEDIVRIIVESKSKEKLDEIREELLSLIR